MDLDDGPKKQDDPITLLTQEDLSSQSIDELKERITTLEQEIARTDALIKSKDQSRDAAEAFFKK